MANSNSKKINMNKKEIEKTLSKKTSTSAKKKNSNKTSNVNKTTSSKKTNTVKVNTPVNKINENKPLESIEIKENPPVVDNNKATESKKENKTVKKKEIDKKVKNSSSVNKKAPPKPKKKENKKDQFKVNKDGSLYDLGSIYPKKKEKKQPAKEKIDNTTGLKGTFFEELSESEEKEKKIENKKDLKKLLIIVVVLALIVVGGFFGYKKYKQYVKEHLRIYEEYKIGTSLMLVDGSTWYVIDYSDKSDYQVRLLSSGLVDVNNDGAINENDKMRFSTDADKYDKTDATGIGYFLLNNYKGALEKKLGFAIDDIDLLSSKEFVRVRDYLGYGYEWNEGNFLANSDLNYYWINSESDKMYVVSPRGTYKMASKENLYFARCVIVVSKDNLKLLDNGE